MPPVPSVFISYSHLDKVWKERLVQQLAVLENQGLLASWDDYRIKAGDEWRKEIEKGMETAKVAVLLVSVNSLTSRFILDTEIPHLLERREQDGVVIFPIVCGDCLWEEVPWLAKLEARPRGGQALASFRGNRVSAELAKIAREILEIVRKGARNSPARVPPVLGPLHQLPSPPGDFTGREAELATLRSALTQGGTGAIFGLQGMGGIGKTSLALKLAAELTPQFPDGRIYLDLKGVTPQPVTSAQAMAHVVRSFEPEARLPESDAELAGRYQSALFRKKVLLLMDNASGRPQVQPLVPSSGSLLLVTSRVRFTLPGMVLQDLDELSEPEARNLLLRIAPRIGPEAGEIARLACQLPLALRLAGSCLAERLNLSPAEYARRLRDGKVRFGEVEASLNLSYELLDEERRRLWRLLAAFPGTFAGPAAAAVWELETDDAEDVLGELVRNSLVEWEEKEERYRLHDLARVFASGRLAAPERESSQKRLAEYFLAVLRAADHQFRQGSACIQAALASFDAEWGNVQAGHAWAARHAAEDDEAARMCAEYPRAGAAVLSLRQHAREQIRWGEIGLAAARQRHDDPAEGALLGNLGLAYAELGETRRAIEIYEQALLIDRKTGDRREEAAVLQGLGQASKNLGATRRAVELYEQCLVLMREIGDRQGEGATLGSLGLAYKNLGDTRRAIKLYEQSLLIVREIGDRRGEAAVLSNLGLVYKNLGKTRRGIGLYEQALAIDREIGDRRGEGKALGNLGNAYADLGQIERAIEFHEQYLAIVREVGDRRGEGKALGNLGNAYADLGETQRALELYEQRLAVAREIGDRRGESKALGNLGNACSALGETRRAREFHEQQLAIACDIGDRRGEGNASWDLGLVYEREGNLARAVDLMQFLVDFEREIGHPDADKHAARVESLRASLPESPA